MPHPFLAHILHVKRFICGLSLLHRLDDDIDLPDFGVFAIDQHRNSFQAHAFRLYREHKVYDGKFDGDPRDIKPIELEQSAKFEGHTRRSSGNGSYLPPKRLDPKWINICIESTCGASE